jgi:hypothetical protein
VDLENVEETPSEELIDEMLGSESESETSVMCLDRWEDVTMGDKNPKKEMASRVRRERERERREIKYSAHFFYHYEKKTQRLHCVQQLESQGRHKRNIFLLPCVLGNVSKDITLSRTSKFLV